MKKAGFAFRPRIAPILAALVLALTAAGNVSAAALKGVTFPDQVVIEGKECRLNGLGVRKKIIISVYLGALYTAAPSKDPRIIIASEEPKRVVLHFVYSKVTAAQINEAWDDGFKDNAAADLPRLQDRLATLKTLFTEDLHEGETIVFTWLPGKGTEVTVKGAVKGVIEGADFMKALFAVWFGEKPADKGLKKGMLGLE